MSQETELLKARIDVMQKEIREALQMVNQDFHTVLNQIMSALNAFDARLSVLEGKPIESDLPKVKIVDESGKEL